MRGYWRGMAKIPLSQMIHAARPVVTTVAGAAVHTAAHAVRHPREAAREATGLARGTAVAVAGLLSPPRHEQWRGDRTEGGADQEPGAAGAGTAAPEKAPPTWDETEANAIWADESLKNQGDPMTSRVTEPSAPPGRGDASELLDEVELPHEEESAEEAGPEVVYTSESEQPEADEPVLDPSVAKQVRHESDVMKHASDPDKG